VDPSTGALVCEYSNGSVLVLKRVECVFAKGKKRLQRLQCPVKTLVLSGGKGVPYVVSVTIWFRVFVLGNQLSCQWLSFSFFIFLVIKGKTSLEGA